MSYKDGIPLLASFDDDVDDDDLNFENVRPRGKCRCSKRTAMFIIVLGLAITLIIGLIVGVTVPLLLLKSPSPNTGSGVKPIEKTNHSMFVSMSKMMELTASISTTQLPSTSLPSTNVHVPLLSSSPTVFLSVSATTPPPSPSPSPTANQSSSKSMSSSFGIKSHSLGTYVPMESVSTTSIVATTKVGEKTTKSLSTTAVGVKTTNSLSSPVPIPTGSVPPTSIVSTTAAGVKTTHSLSSPVLSPTPSVMPPPPSNENCTEDDIVCHSKLDDRQYRVMTLGNGLRVLLISDPNSNISAAAMDVPAGSFNDPMDYEGLAHFCEHMLFIGTGKYPNLNQYSSYLQTHGGGDNAYTSTQNTNYFFNIEAEYFPTALDMFAHFFIDPLFSASSVMDEMNAVNAEHQKNLQSDNWKLWQLLKHVSNPQHPFSQFSTGSLETLNKSDIHDQLLLYFNNSYSANTVSLNNMIG